MSSIGPDLPPHLLAKRKRQAEDEKTTVKAATVAPNPSKSPEGAEKRRRVMGPAPPPAPLDELPSASAQNAEDSSSSDDDYGPSMPTEKPSAVRPYYRPTRRTSTEHSRHITTMTLKVKSWTKIALPNRY